jgi:hypothetical protein
MPLIDREAEIRTSLWVMYYQNALTGLAFEPSGFELLNETDRGTFRTESSMVKIDRKIVNLSLLSLKVR